MAAPCSKAEYLKKYLSANAEEKKKKRKKKTGIPAKIPRSRIVDDDVDFNSLLPENLANTLEEDVGDNEPLIADVIDDRPEHVKLLEKYRSSGAWKVMGNDDTNAEDRRRHDSDSDSSPVRRRHDSDSDQSPVRRKRHDSDSDQSLVRRKRHDSDSDQSLVRRKRHDSDSDQSPIRRKRHDSDSDQSPVRRKRHDSDSDQSPVRRKRHSDSDQSPVRRKRHDSDSSPPRKVPKTYRNKTDLRKRRNDSDSDQSVPRRGDKNRRQYSDSDQSPVRRRNDSDNDLSPPRKQNKRKADLDSDYSQYRKHSSSSRSTRHRHDSGSDLSPPRSKNKKSQNDGHGNKEEKTLSGKRAGLSSAQEMRREAEELKRKEDDKFKQISDERLGKGAETVFRDKSGRKRNLAEERRKESEEAKIKAKEDEKYQNWGKGLKQIEKQNQQVEDAMHEMSKPLARYKDDDDLDDMLRNMDRAEDPMLAFISKKKVKNKGPPVKEKPRYKGPAPAPNRFGIMPGYRWDGVDRSNGFEKQVYAKQAERKAVSAQAYKWSVEDM